MAFKQSAKIPGIIVQDDNVHQSQEISDILVFAPMEHYAAATMHASWTAGSKKA